MIPIIYNVRSIRIRWWTNLVAILAIAGVVSVFIAMLSMARGFQATLVESGSGGNALVRRGGATSEMDSILTLDQVRVISDAAQVARDKSGRPLACPELVVVAAFLHKASDAEALAQVRGTTGLALDVHSKVKVISGRLFKPGLAELVVGSRARDMYVGLELGSRPSFAGRTWTVVGIMDSSGSAFDSEIWCDRVVLSQTYKRPESSFSSMTVRLAAAVQFESFRETLAADPRLTVQVEPEIEYYRKQSRGVATMIRVLGCLVAAVMGIGAVFGAVNTMYSAIAARSKELATLRALGFGGASIVASMMLESVFISLMGGILGSLVVLPLHGLTTSTLNWQTFSQVAFAFRITPDLVAGGIVFSALMGAAGGLAPSLRAARFTIASALREL